MTLSRDIILDYWGRPNLLTRPLKHKSRDLSLTGGRRQTSEACHCWPEEENENLSYSRKELNSANNLTSLGVESPPEPADKSPGWPTPWLWPCEVLSRGLS